MGNNNGKIPHELQQIARHDLRIESEADLTDKNINSITKMIISGTGLKTLDGIQKFANLVEVRILFNELENIKALLDLERLETVCLRELYLLGESEEHIKILSNRGVSFM